MWRPSPVGSLLLLPPKRPFPHQGATEPPAAPGAPLFCCPRPGQRRADLCLAVAVPGDGEVPRAGSLTSITSITLPHALPFLELGSLSLPFPWLNPLCRNLSHTGQ